MPGGIWGCAPGGGLGKYPGGGGPRPGGAGCCAGPGSATILAPTGRGMPEGSEASSGAVGGVSVLKNEGSGAGGNASPSSSDSKAPNFIDSNSSSTVVALV